MSRVGLAHILEVGIEKKHEAAAIVILGFNGDEACKLGWPWLFIGTGKTVHGWFSLIFLRAVYSAMWGRGTVTSEVIQVLL